MIKLSWEDMSDKERNDYLENLGGCGNCSYWYDNNDILLGLLHGCNNKQVRQLYDNGCEYINPIKKF